VKAATQLGKNMVISQTQFGIYRETKKYLVIDLPNTKKKGILAKFVYKT